jgi:hypothetical protein
MENTIKFDENGFVDIRIDDADILRLLLDGRKTLARGCRFSIGQVDIFGKKYDVTAEICEEKDAVLVSSSQPLKFHFRETA